MVSCLILKPHLKLNDLNADNTHIAHVVRRVTTNITFTGASFSNGKVEYCFTCGIATFTQGSATPVSSLHTGQQHKWHQITIKKVVMWLKNAVL